MRLGPPSWLGPRVLGELVRHVGDSDIERRLGVRLVQRAIVGAMVRGYTPSAGEGFQGKLVFELTRPATGGPSAWWTIEVREGGAVASEGEGVDDGAALVVRIPLGDFMRVAGGVIDPAEPMLNGRATLTGDLGVAARLAEMFGAPRPRR